MRFLVDECTGPAVARWLQSQGHEVLSVYDELRGMTDEDIIQRAFAENWILVTNDKGFGEKVCREGLPHKGVILLRLDDERAKHKVQIMGRLLDGYADRLPNQFVTVTETQVRFARAEGQETR
jgi:predicted nuclease of predicted toxin-antitoxin system